MSQPPPPPPPPQPQHIPYAQPAYHLQDAESKKIAAGICGILLGALGIHKFILGYTSAGVIMLLVSVLTCGLGGIVMHVFGLIEGIIYLTKTNEQFYETYIYNRKEWF